MAPIGQDGPTQGTTVSQFLGHSPLPDNLACAIGQIIHATTRLEWYVSCFAYGAGGEAPGYLLMTRPGATMRAARDQINAINADDELRARLIQWLDDVEQLRRERNELVHACWSDRDGAWIGQSYKDGSQIATDAAALDHLLQRILQEHGRSFLHTAAITFFGLISAQQAGPLDDDGSSEQDQE